MTTCATGCGRPTRDTLLLCEQCQWEIKQALNPDHELSIPALLDDLATTLTRQARINQRNGGGRSAETPLPFHIRASDIAEHARSVLTGWVLVIAEDDPRNYPADTLLAMCAWLRSRTGHIATHDAAADIHAEITDTAARIQHVIDRPADRLYAGTCGTSFAEQHTCEEPLYAHPGATVVRCIDCGTVHEVEKRRTDMLQRLDDRLVTAAEFARLAAYLIDDARRRREQTRKLINQWHSRGLLTRHGSDDGEPRFVFGEIKLLLAKDQARREQRDAERQAVSAAS